MQASIHSFLPDGYNPVYTIPSDRWTKAFRNHGSKANESGHLQVGAAQ